MRPSELKELVDTYEEALRAKDAAAWHLSAAIGAFKEDPTTGFVPLAGQMITYHDAVCRVRQCLAAVERKRAREGE